ncbi:MAG: hypothetical protein IJ868_05265 [Prevotella sp.]|nr:hypothetical protein [Prevotella sp.]
MEVGQIIKEVRWCFDEEAANNADFIGASDRDSALMDNIIKAKIGDALRWVCLYAPADVLNGSDSGTDTDIVREARLGPGVTYGGMTLNINNEKGYGTVTLPADFVKLARIRVDNWHRAVTTPIAEDSDEYLQLNDENGATATYDRPQAAIIETLPKKIEAWPMKNQDGGCTVTVVCAPSVSVDTDTRDDHDVAMPPKAKAAIIYYLAFLVLSAYEDSRAARMLEIAKMNLGLTDDRQRA